MGKCNVCWLLKKKNTLYEDDNFIILDDSSQDKIKLLAFPKRCSSVSDNDLTYKLDLIFKRYILKNHSSYADLFQYNYHTSFAKHYHIFGIYKKK